MASQPPRKVATEGGMRVLTVRHVTVYPYMEPVRVGRTSHDVPAAGDCTISAWFGPSFIILPRPVRLRWLHDVFDDSVAVATFAGETTKLYFDSTVTLEHTEVALPDYQLEDTARPPSHSANEMKTNRSGWRTRAKRAERGSRSLGQRNAARTGRRVTMELLRSMTLRIRNQVAYSHRGERGVQDLPV